VKKDDLFITEGVYMVAGDSISFAEDAAAFLVLLDEPVLIDTGAGRSIKKVIENIKTVGVDPASIEKVIITHCHIDHIGGMPYLKEKFGVRFYMHRDDAGPIEVGDSVVTAAGMYGTTFPPTPVDATFSEPEFILEVGNNKIHLLHTPGHTPGSISPYVDIDETRVLFAQDVHGPFLDVFGSDLQKWRESMEKLLALNPDILCEGHFGIYEPRERALAYIRGYLDRYAHQL
jgi:glyoxylase-like metal-dependent hydrolase (beta-lactamase superfamily II)